MEDTTPNAKSERDPAKECQRCRSGVSQITLRNEALCVACFQKYIKSKIVKRLEAIRTTFFFPSGSSGRAATTTAPRRRRAEKLNILLPLSFSSSSSSSSSSLVLLDVLSEYLDQQVARSRRAAFSVHVCHVHFPRSSSNSTSANSSSKIRNVESTAQNTKEAESIETNYKKEESIETKNTIDTKDKEESIETNNKEEEKKDAEEVEAEKKLAEIQQRYPNHSYTLLNPRDTDRDGKKEGKKLVEILDSLKSPSSRVDIEQTLLITTVAEAALALNCEAVLWGDSTTRLAEKILAHAAKGRGASIPWLVNDCRSPYPYRHPRRHDNDVNANVDGTVKDEEEEEGEGEGGDADEEEQDGLVFAYPMRDLLGKEIASFANFACPALPLAHSHHPLSTSSFDGESLPPQDQQQEKKKFVVNSKTASIDALMHDYFRSVELEYPSIVANVVRTSSKLRPPSDLFSLAENEKEKQKTAIRLCEICNMPLLPGPTTQPRDRAENGEAHAQIEEEEEGDQEMCYGCAQSISGAT